MDDIMARGPNFIYTKEFIIREYGDSLWNTLLQALPEQTAAIWNGPVLVTETYPFLAFKTLVRVLADVVGSMTEQETAALYEYIADRSLTTVYKVFFRFANPSFAIKNYPKLWQRFFTSGTVDVPVAQKGYALIQFTLPNIFLDWLSPACYGYSKKAVELAGGKELRMQQMSQTRVKDGLWQISYELFWNE